MSETSIPAQDLDADVARIERVRQLARDHGVEIGGALLGLRQKIERADQDRAHDLALGQAFARQRWVDERRSVEALLTVAADIRIAVASVGAEIAWPTPEPSEGQDRTAETRTAPETEGVSDERADWEKLLDEDPEPTAREKILAEVAASTAAESLPSRIRPGSEAGA